MDLAPLYGLLLLIGGVGLFLYGSNECPDNIRKYLGKSGKAFLSHVGAKRGSSFLFGTLLSVMMQSSAAASSFAVGLVEVGLLASERALLVIMGASVGTGLIVYFLSLDLILYSPLIFAVIVFLGRFTKRRLKEYFKIAEGIAIVFFGMSLIKLGSYPLVYSSHIQNLLSFLTQSAILLAVTTYLLTSVVQSSTATLAIAIGMASSGLLPFSAILPLVLGAYVGSSSSALLAALGKKRKSQGLAWSAFLYRAFGIVPMIPLGLLYLKVGENLPISMGAHIALLQMLLVLVNVIVSLPFTSVLSKMGEGLASLSEKEAIEPLYLDWDFVDVTALAVSLLSKEIVRTSNFLEEFLYGLFYGNIDEDHLYLLKASLPDLVNSCIFYRSAITWVSNEDQSLTREFVITSYSLNALKNMVTLATERLFPLMTGNIDMRNPLLSFKWEDVKRCFFDVFTSSLGAYALDDPYFANKAFRSYSKLSVKLGEAKNELMLSHCTIEDGMDLIDLLTLLDAFLRESLEFARAARRYETEYDERSFVDLQGEKEFDL